MAEHMLQALKAPCHLANPMPPTNRIKDMQHSQSCWTCKKDMYIQIAHCTQKIQTATELSFLGKSCSPMLRRKCLARFHIVGGECNYLLRVNDECRLEFVSKRDWMSDLMLCWTKEDIRILLDEAEAILKETACHLRLPVEVGLTTVSPILINSRSKSKSIWPYCQFLSCDGTQLRFCWNESQPSHPF